MKKMILIVTFYAALQALAIPTVQRTPNSSYEDYKKYLNQSGATTFVDAYIQISSVTELETPLLEKCLEEVYLGAPAASTCLTAVKSLTSKPLNQPRREVLFSFLSKLEKVKSPQKAFYQELKQGLLRTHVQLSRAFNASRPEAEAQDAVLALEMRAWRKALSQKFPLEEVGLLINGKRVSNLEKWTAPSGIYQWSLVTNTHEPLVRLGTFSQFAAESLKGLKPLAAANCKELETFDIQRFGLMQLEVFANNKCVARFGLSTPVAKSEHLGSSSSMVKMESPSSRHWIWPVLAMMTVGLASSLKDKQVSIQMPGAH